MSEVPHTHDAVWFHQQNQSIRAKIHPRTQYPSCCQALPDHSSRHGHGANLEAVGFQGLATIVQAEVHDRDEALLMRIEGVYDISQQVRARIPTTGY